MTRTRVLALLGVLLLGAPVAQAHLLTCRKTIDGKALREVTTYPVTLNYELQVDNAHPTAASDVLAAEDELLTAWDGYAFSPAPPFELALGASARDEHAVTIRSYEECLLVAAMDGVQDSYIDNVFRVTWDVAEAQCRARVICVPPVEVPCDNTDQDTTNDCRCDDTDDNANNDCPPVPCNDGDEDTTNDCPEVPCDNTDQDMTNDCRCDDTDDNANNDCPPVPCDNTDDDTSNDCPCNDDDDNQDNDCPPPPACDDTDTNPNNDCPCDDNDPNPNNDCPPVPCDNTDADETNDCPCDDNDPNPNNDCPPVPCDNTDADETNDCQCDDGDQNPNNDCPPPPCDNTDQDETNDCPCDDEDPNPNNDCPVVTGGATRTQGYYSTHTGAFTQCLAETGPIDLGFVTIVTLADAEGLLHASVSRYEDGERRTNVDQRRVQLGAQLLVAICNNANFGTRPTPTTLFADAVAALDGTSCTEIADLIGPVTDFNEGGDGVDFPPGFIVPPNDRAFAESIANDPTTPSGEVCE